MKSAKFSVGQVVHHRLFDYRGVVMDVDPSYQSSENWYDLLIFNQPPKDKPWYHILVDGEDYITYVAEQNLELDESGLPVLNTSINKYFGELINGSYVIKKRFN